MSKPSLAELGPPSGLLGFSNIEPIRTNVNYDVKPYGPRPNTQRLSQNVSRVPRNHTIDTSIPYPSLGNMEVNMPYGIGRSPSDFTPEELALADREPFDWGSLNDWNKGMEAFSLGANGLLAIQGLLNSRDQNKLLKRQFAASLADRNQQIANQATTTNLALSNQARQAAYMRGLSEGTPEYQAYLDANQRQVNGDTIRV